MDFGCRVSCAGEHAAHLLDAAERLRHAAVELLDRAMFDGIEVDAAVVEADVSAAATTAVVVATQLADALSADASGQAQNSHFRVVIAVHRL